MYYCLLPVSSTRASRKKLRLPTPGAVVRRPGLFALWLYQVKVVVKNWLEFIFLSSRTTTLSIVILSMCSFFRVSRNAFLRPESVCKVTALFCLCQKARQCLTLFNFSAPRLACRRRHSRKASAKVRPFSSTAKFFRTFFRGFFAKTGPRTPKTLSFHNIAQRIFLWE